MGRSTERPNRRCPHRLKTRATRGRGFLLADTIVALAILGVLLGVLLTAIGQQQKAARKLADSRAAARAAEAALYALASGRPPAAPWAGDDPAAPAQVAVRPLPDAPPAPGLRWVEVTATVNGTSASLVGAAPDPATPAAPGGGVP